MFIGVGTIELRMEWSESLKDKRRVVKSLLARVRSKFNVSAAEIDCQDQWKTAVLGFAVVSSDGSLARQVLDGIVRFVESHTEAEVVSCRTEIL